MDRLWTAKLTVNLVKNEFGHAQVTYLEHVVGQGKVSPVNVKTDVIVDFHIPTSRREVMRFLGMAGYYRKF